MPEVGTSAVAGSTRARIVVVATELLAAGGRGAVSTTAVSAAAGVRAAEFYQLFGGKWSLLAAVAAQGYVQYQDAETHRQHRADPVEDLRAGWDAHVAFGLTNPFLYSLLYGDPQPGVRPPEAVTTFEILAAHVHRISEEGRLRVGEGPVADLLSAAGRGTTLALISRAIQDRDLVLSEVARESVIAAITGEGRSPLAPRLVVAAITLRAMLPQISALTMHERNLLQEWLERITNAPAFVLPAPTAA